MLDILKKLRFHNKNETYRNTSTEIHKTNIQLTEVAAL